MIVRIKKEGGNQIFPMPQVSERAARKNLIAILLGMRGVCKRGICLAETTDSYEFGMSSELSMHSEWNIAIPLSY